MVVPVAGSESALLKETLRSEVGRFMLESVSRIVVIVWVDTVEENLWKFGVNESGVAVTYLGPSVDPVSVANDMARGGRGGAS